MHFLRRRLQLAMILVLALSLAARVPSYAQTNEKQFPETGFYVRGEFLKAYLSADNPQLLYGNPISGEVSDPATGMLVQYFERARFELHTELLPPLLVKLTPLGYFLYKPGESLDHPINSTGCKYYSATGFQVCYSFLDFFLAHGGVKQFGFPISNFEFKDGHLVQYFQNSRFEWHPEMPAGKRVVLSNVGSDYYRLHQADIPDSNGRLATIRELNLRAYPAKAVTGFEGEQQIYVTVFDQRWNPVENAQVALRVQFPDGRIFAHPQQMLTDEKGVAVFGFPFETTSPGLFKIFIDAKSGELKTNTVTSFRAWW